jgi:hypothetical protein
VIESVRDAYDPKDFWSKVAKGLCGRSLFGRKRLEWRAAMHDFLQEFANMEDLYGPVLKGTGEVVDEFLARLASRLCMSGDITEAEKTSILAAGRGKASAMPELRSERAKALLLKACFEMGRLRPTPGDIYPRRGLLTVDDLLECPLGTPLEKENRATTAAARAMPEYHMTMNPGDIVYCHAVYELSLAYENLDRAFEAIDRRGPSSDKERRFHSKYRSVAESIGLHAGGR